MSGIDDRDRSGERRLSGNRCLGCVSVVAERWSCGVDFGHDHWFPGSAHRARCRLLVISPGGMARRPFASSRIAVLLVAVHAALRLVAAAGGLPTLSTRLIGLDLASAGSARETGSHRTIERTTVLKRIGARDIAAEQIFQLIG